MTLSHWLALSSVKDHEKRQTYIDTLFKQGLTANDLEAEIKGRPKSDKGPRQGGRQHKSPTSGVAGLQKAGGLAQVLQPFAALYLLILAVLGPLLTKESERIYGLLATLFGRLNRLWRRGRREAEDRGSRIEGRGSRVEE